MIARVVRTFRDHAEAEEEDRRAARALSPSERLERARELVRRVHGDPTRLPDVREAERRRSA